ncbi:hypothetical protein COLO4_31764 [Corchorus olitorius]|uniref:Uncharacterized protein n=1 Tax=Corchorus olitorius TaxID=93759 RepID=A0A1R3H3C7_9ROSI|nr:hypothetical protein COLO4_31764 [Corchorus olitorius]
MEIREEMEQERKMLQMAEVLREERVQMKLSDAKLALEKAVKSVSDIQDIEPCFNCSSNGDVSDNDHVPKNSRDSPNAEVHEEWSISGQQSKLKTSSNGGVLGLGGTFASPWTIFTIRKSVGRIRHQRYSMGQWGVKDMVNPHIAGGIKGCIESSRGFQKNITVKAKLWEARIDSEKAELQTD